MWFPQYVALAYVLRGDVQPCLTDDCEYKGVMTTFGVLSLFAGLAGLAIGLFGSQYWKKDRGPGKPGNQRADAELCAIGQFVFAVCLMIALLGAQNCPTLTWAAMFLGSIGGCINWALGINMTMYTCIPKRRSFANALQNFTSHILGDAFSPLLIGIISEYLQSNKRDAMGPTFFAEFQSLQYAMLLCPLVSVLGGLCFLISAHNIVQDKALVDDYISKTKENAKLTESNEMVGLTESNTLLKKENSSINPTEII